MDGLDGRPWPYHRAAFGWIVASIGFWVYMDNFGRYGATYGGLAGVVVLLLWLYIGALSVLFGAEFNAEAGRGPAGGSGDGGGR